MVREHWRAPHLGPLQQQKLTVNLMPFLHVWVAVHQVLQCQVATNAAVRWDLYSAATEAEELH